MTGKSIGVITIGINVVTRIKNQISALLISIRPQQWIKNMLVFGGLIFSQSFLKLDALLLSIAAFIVFCLASSAIYLFNDLRDIEEDRQHPIKCHRPLASGLLSVQLTWIIMISMLLIAVSGAILLRPAFAMIIIIYLILNILYSMFLKKQVILDVMIVSFGFVLRAVAGALVIAVEVSPWLFLCTLMLALLVSFGKRRHELVLLNNNAHQHRMSLKEYSPPFLDIMMTISGAAALVTYSLYTMASETIARFGTQWLVLSTLFVLYGIFRYFYLVHQKNAGGDPSNLFVKDIPTLINVLLWGLSVILIIYFSLV